MVAASQGSERHVIGPNTPILGGVFLGYTAIVVDYVENPGPYEDAYARVDALIPAGQKESLLPLGRAVNQVIRELVPYSTEKAAAVLRDEAEALGVDRIDEDHRIPLSRYIYRGGNCQPSSLLGAGLLELYDARYVLGGKPNIDIFDIDDQHDPLRHINPTYSLGGETVIIANLSDHVYLASQATSASEVQTSREQALKALREIAVGSKALGHVLP